MIVFLLAGEAVSDEIDDLFFHRGKEAEFEEVLQRDGRRLMAPLMMSCRDGRLYQGGWQAYDGT